MPCPTFPPRCRSAPLTPHHAAPPLGNGHTTSMPAERLPERSGNGPRKIAKTKIPNILIFCISFYFIKNAVHEKDGHAFFILDHQSPGTHFRTRVCDRTTCLRLRVRGDERSTSPAGRSQRASPGWRLAREPDQQTQDFTSRPRRFQSLRSNPRLANRHGQQHGDMKPSTSGATIFQ